MGRFSAARPWATLALTVLSLAVAGCNGDDGGGNATPPQPGPNATYAADIRRTSFGIPHILARDEASLGFGIGYAYAQDNFCILADEIVTVNGERSKYFGPTAANIYQRNNLRMDFYFKLINDDAQVDAHWARQSPEVQALYTGYVAGYNKFLRGTGVANLPGDCKGQPWVRPITTRDLTRLARRLSVEASGINFIDALFAAQPPATVAARAQRTSLTQMAHATLAAKEGPLSKAYWDELRERIGSNAVALGSEATDSGRGMLLGNPHFPWFGILRFYQMHLTIPGRMNVMGGALNGFPGINIGFNENFAWSHTVNTSVHYTLYALTLDPADPTRYVYDGQSVPMTRRTLTVEVKQADGSVVPQTRTYYGSSHGPILVVPGQLTWTAANAFALRDANLENWRLAEQWYRMNRAASLDEFKSAIKDVLGIPWVNTVAVDRAGNGYYASITVTPNVPAALEAACVPAPFKPLIAAANMYVLAGSTAACEWAVDPSTPQPGIFAAASLPELARRDFLANSNDSAWLANPAAPLTGFPNIVSKDSTPQNGRTRIGILQIQARLAGTDGRAGNKFTLPLLQDTVLSNRMYFAEIMLPDALAAMCSGSLSHTVDGQAVDLTRACNVLSQWDRRAELTSVGVPLFEAWWAQVGKGSSNYAVQFSPADPVNTPRGIAQGNPAVTTALRDALARSVLQLAAAGIAYDKPWGGIQLASKNVPIPIHGGSHRAGDGGTGIYNAIISAPVPQLPGARIVNYGSSYLQTVTWDDGGPVADAFLTYSNSSNPASLNYADQTLRFANKEWIRQAFGEGAIRGDPAYAVITVTE
jgi:acyl-homoserine-lactone acylase